MGRNWETEFENLEEKDYVATYVASYMQWRVAQTN